jgi:hypothetical protein
MFRDVRNIAYLSTGLKALCIVEVHPPDLAIDPLISLRAMENALKNTSCPKNGYKYKRKIPASA